MPLSPWITFLARRGLTLSAPSHAVPVDLWAVDAPGAGYHLRFRGASVRLEVWSPSDLRRVVPGSVVELLDHPTVAEHLVPAAEAPDHPLVVLPGAGPARVLEIDGAARFGWTGCEAGRLRFPAAAPLVDELLDEALSDAAETQLLVASLPSVTSAVWLSPPRS